MIAPRYVGAFDDHDVAAVEERLADELERLDRAARDQQLVVGGPPALQRSSLPATASSAPASPRVGAYWNAADSPAAANSCEQRGGALARERQRVGEPAGERDQVRPAQQREDGRDPFTDVPARPLRKEPIPARRLARYRHVTRYRRVGRPALSRREETKS